MPRHAPGSARASRSRRRSEEEPDSGPGAASKGAAFVVLRAQGGVRHRVRCGRELQRAAMRWSYIVRNRRRWGRGAAPEALAALVESELKDLGLREDGLRELAAAGVVEVSVPYRTDDSVWEAQVFPWEYLLSAATRRHRGARSLCVVRHLAKPEGEGAAEREEMPLLFVESAPGRLAGLYSFEFEKELVERQVAGAKIEVVPLANPSPRELKKKVAELSPRIIHVSAIDVHQGAQLLGRGERTVSRDGVLLRGERSPSEPEAAVDARTLAGILNAGRPPAEIVSLNFHHSAARIGAYVVAGGAGAAIGFMDSFDDALAEGFFASFYRLFAAQPDLLVAFQGALSGLPRGSRRLHGTGVVLWSARPLLRRQKEPPPRKAAAVAEIARGDRKWRDILRVEVTPHDKLNYSVLHNGRGLFRSFWLRKLEGGPLKGIGVEVVLSVGAESFPYRATVDLAAGDSSRDLVPQVKVPLTSTLARSLEESVYTSLVVSVRVEDEEVYCDSFRVALLAVDEWRDDRLDGRLLPSFVFSRDPAVARIASAAQRYLMALADDAGAGFDGYQSDADGVDRQVRAMWLALIHDHPLNYVNPPPTFTERSQRLRTPSVVLGESRGTCIDLALLLSACLESVGIHPVLFLYRGHAFPGYWRADEDHEAFRIPRLPIEGPEDSESGGWEETGQKDSWFFGPRFFGPRFYGEVLQLVRDGRIVPLETTLLAERASFADAISLGMKNLQRREEFESMMDVSFARSEDVTPLPLAGGRK